MDMNEYIKKQIDWSHRTFGPGERNAGVLEHIRKEIEEVESDPDDVMEFVDIVILAVDGAWRRLVHQGLSPTEAARRVTHLLTEKQITNINRKWPDWRTVPQGTAVEHIRD
jgi:hypothetical protein